MSDAIPVLTDRKSLLSEDSLLERVIAAAEERQLSIHSSPQPAHNRVSTGSRRIADTSLATSGWSAFELQEPAGGRRCLLPIKELSGGPTGLSLASRPGTQSCAALLHRLLALRPAGQRMASQRRKRRGPTTAAPVAGNSSRYLENRRPRLQAPADPDST